MSRCKQLIILISQVIVISFAFLAFNQHQIISSEFSNNTILMAPRSIRLIACGSFNPITIAHLRMFELARDFLEKESETRFKVEKGIISPVNDAYGEKKNLARASTRVQMVKLAIEEANVSDWIEVHDWESKNKDWTPTVDVLRYHEKLIEEQYPDPNDRPLLKLLCGSDLLRTFAKPGLWSDDDLTEIVGHFGLVVITRLDSDPFPFVYESDLLSKHSHGIQIVREWIGNQISATRVRRALRRGLSVKYIVSDSVVDFIKEEGLYTKE